MKSKLGVLLLLALTTLSVSAESGYGIQQTWKLSGSGGWGALVVDASSHRLYIPRTNRIAVIDTTTGQQTGEIHGVVDARAIALDASGKFGYITDIADGRGGFLRIFDQSTQQIIATVPVGINPDAVVFDAATNMVAVLSRHDRSAALLDAKTNRIAATVPLPGVPSNAVTDGNGTIFATIIDKAELVRIDLKVGRVSAAWPVSGCVGPTGLAMDAQNRQLFTVCENSKIVAVQADDGARIASVATSAGPGTVAFDPQRKRIFVADSSGRLTLIQRTGEARFALEQTVPVTPGSYVLALDQASDKAYLVAAEYGQRTDDVSEELRLRPAPAAGKCAVVVVGRLASMSARR